LPEASGEEGGEKIGVPDVNNIVNIWLTPALSLLRNEERAVVQISMQGAAVFRHPGRVIRDFSG
jgi:hypothetical protein